ncbi:Protein memo1 [Perkinsus olseni]|uniref:Protein memo1 n=2 Tax=Perkinsus olseni TaxID=32597 RepID=A0A7J6KYK2_PEROL|nr:Protein memo1 [Perkinsus olseni]
MQLPLIFHQLHHRLGVRDNLTIVPIIVGVLSPNVERVVGRLLAKYFKDPGTLFIISSDFCHWGLRFRYTQLQRDKTKFPKTMVFDSEEHPVNAGIEAMDREGMALIEKQDFEGFKRYLQMTGNTICGRHPISVLLEILRNVKEEHIIKFVDYNQSTILPSAPSRNDSCVAYAAGVITVDE